MKKLIIIVLFFGILPNFTSAEQYPNTSVGILDLNRVLLESKAALDAAKQIEVIQKKVENEAKEQDESIIKEREKLIEQQSVMAPEAFEVKVNAFDKKVQEYQLTRQEELRKLDKMVQSARSKILDQIKVPILIQHERLFLPNFTKPFTNHFYYV